MMELLEKTSDQLDCWFVDLYVRVSNDRRFLLALDGSADLSDAQLPKQWLSTCMNR